MEMLSSIVHSAPRYTLMKIRSSRIGLAYGIAMRKTAECRRVLIEVMSRFSVLRFLYCRLTPSFDREKCAVLKGMAAYNRHTFNGLSESSVRLRRNIHRLEKGLCMRPRRSIFAEDYIGSTVEAYECLLKALGSGGKGIAEKQWAYSVLSQYFEFVGDSVLVCEARNKFSSLPALTLSDACRPYARDLSKTMEVSYDGLHELVLRRRSVRWFLKTPVPRSMLDNAINIARYAPSACNRQPFEYRIFDKHELVQELASFPLGTSGWGHNIPVLVAVVGSLNNFFSGRDKHVIYIDGSLSTMLFVEALETLGLSSCLINWADIRSKDVDVSKFLRLRDDQRVIMLIAVGFPDPDGLVPYSAKKETEALREYNFENH